LLVGTEDCIRAVLQPALPLIKIKKIKTVQ